MNREQKYTWVQTHKEIADFLKGKENKQKELIKILKKAGIEGFRDRDESGEMVELDVIDPFTFYCYIYIYGPEQRLIKLKNVAEQTGASIPSDESGIPSVFGVSTHLFPQKKERKGDEIGKLWDFFYSVLEDSVTEEQFIEVFNIKGVGPSRITEALFYVDPETYLPINGPTKPYLKEILGVNPKFSTWQEYLEILNQVKERTDIPFYELSYEAWAWNEEQKKTNYWVFQCNPSKFDVISELKNNSLSDWTVDSHKDKIKKGDQVILWVTGKQAGCYALCETTSGVYEDTIEVSHKRDVEQLTNRVDMKITHNLVENPVLKAEVEQDKRLSDLNVGHQGTNFTATKDEYEALLEIAEPSPVPDSKWDDLVTFVLKVDDELAVRKFFRAAGHILDTLGIDEEDPVLYAAIIKDDMHLTVGGKITVVLKRMENQVQLGFYIKYKYLDELKEKYPGIQFKKEYDREDTEQIFVRVDSGDANLEDFYEGALALARESRDSHSKSPYRSTYSENHNPWIIRTSLDESILEKIFVKHYLLGSSWGGTDDKTNDFLVNGIWENGQDGKFIEHVKEVPEGSKVAIKASFAEGEESKMRIKARGIVTKNFKDGHKLLIKWEEDFDSFDVDFSAGYWSRIHEITKPKHIISIWYRDSEKDVDINALTNKMNLDYPLNTIFYGPPGTGKTYNTIKRAAEIVEQRPIDSYEKAQEIFNRNLGDTIEFITFHQNYSYEDFIQGLRPDIENEKELTFERKEGIFKRLADRALKNLKESDKPKAKKKSFEAVFNEFVTPLVEGEVEEIEVEMKRVSYFITAVTNRSIEFRKASGYTDHTLSISTLRKMYEAESVLEIQGLASYYSPLLNELLTLGKSDSETEVIDRKNYVLIIDEINRANISRVFGELITLIEPDKRSEGEFALTSRLPSGEEFAVPSNLYIIGTMNTADKSIALLDIALRRRFEFEAMYPKYEIDGEKIHDVDVLRKINERIIKLKGHDFQIGHSYFMKKTLTLTQRMNRKVIPLLLEYFMNDEDEVKDILKHAGLKIEEKSWPIRITGKA